MTISRVFSYISLGLLCSYGPAHTFGMAQAASITTAGHTRVLKPQLIDKDAVESRINSLMETRPMTGLAIALVEDGYITYSKGFGETIKGSGQKVSRDTVFRWASISKGVAAAVTLSLVEDGDISLATPAKTYAPSLSLPQSNHEVTLENLLAHQVGIVRNAYDKKIEDGQSAKAVRASLGDVKNVCPPGTCHSYQNVTFDSLAEVARNVSGLPYKALVSERIFKPLGMRTASTTYDGLLRSKNWARPHNRNGSQISRVKPNYYRLPAAAGVNSSVTDLAKWMRAQMDVRPPNLKSSIRTSMQQARIETPREANFLKYKFNALENARYGLGWRIYDYGGRKVVGHRGGVQGYRSLVLFDPEIRTGVAIMWNSSHSEPLGLQLEIMDQVYGLPRRDWMRIGPK